MRYVYLVYFFLVLATISILGFRGSKETKPPLEFFPDMDHQAHFKPQSANSFFANDMADRPLPAGVVAYGRTDEHPDPNFLRADPFLYEGKDARGNWARGFPPGIKVDMQLMERGRDRFTIYCAPCHGALGDGHGITTQYGMAGVANYHDQRLVDMAEGEIFNTITHGKGLMLSYADKLTPQDRWAVIAYVRALQRAWTGTASDVPPAYKSQLGIK